MLRFTFVSLVVLVFLVASPGCNSSSNSPELGALGADCTSGDGCNSGFCNADLCSECEADGDCGADETCVDDSDGVGYFVCQADALGALGDACTDGAECRSGFCNADLCSECETDADCGANETCVDDTDGVGYFVCQADALGDLGDACTAGTECRSGFCNADLCSECEADADCAGAQTCVDDTGGLGYFVCQGGQGALGDVCAEGGDCASGFCNTDVCSDCEADADCPNAGNCVDDMAGVGYFVCEDGLGDLGDACADGAECSSGFCSADVCSECAADGDCAANEICVDDLAGAGYFICQADDLGALGDVCAAGADCASGYCNNDACSECEGNGDCDVQQECAWDQGAGYASCAGTGDLGDSCNTGDQCVSGYCNGGVCSECEADGDCLGGGACTDDTGQSGYFICTGGLGDACADGAECASGFCNNDICSECLVNGDCDVQQDCNWDPGLDYFTCQGTGDLGDSCDNDGQCADGFCAGGVCSECAADGDCGQTGSCVDDTAGVGWWVCVSGLGEVCNDPAQCGSGFCYNPPGPGPRYCSECAEDVDCGNQQVCVLDQDLGWAICVGDGALGDPCVSPDECIADFCTADVCSGCAVDGDCSGGGTCEDGTQDVGYYYCTGGLGDDCQAGADCASGYCYDPFWPGGMICSECEADGDCAAQQACEYEQGLNYAICVGTGDLGDSCATGAECQSLICNTDICSECLADADCGEGGTCLDDTGDSGYFVCSGGLGDRCQTGADCTSSYCFDMPGPLDPVCSECETDNDCQNGNCQVDWISFYAVCAN